MRTPPNIIPGLPNFYSTANIQDGYATGVVIKHSMGRPTKVEGNPNHPASLGATDVFAQAQLLDFYDLERAWAISARGYPSTRENLESALALQRIKFSENRGKGFRILTGAFTSPTLMAQLDALIKATPRLAGRNGNPLSRDNVSKGAALAYGQPVDLTLKLDQADVIVAIDSDLLSAAPGHLRYARDFASRRNPTRTRKMSRIYAIEPTPTLTGAIADHRFVAGPRELIRSSWRWPPVFFTTIAVGCSRLDGRCHCGSRRELWTRADPCGTRTTARNACAGACDERGAWRAVDNSGIDRAIGPDGEPATASLDELVDEMRAGKVNALVIIDSNPVYAAPRALGFVEALKRVEFSLTLSTTPNETSNETIWAVPMAHAWESWSDARAYDGVATILQPQALPLYDGIDIHTMLALFAGSVPASPLEIVQATWKPRMAKDFAGTWRDALADGVISNTASPKVDARLRASATRLTPPEPPNHPMTLLFRPDPYIWDGRYANNPWLQELPRPLTKLTWDNPLLISPALAKQSKLQNMDIVRISAGDEQMEAPVWIMPGQAPDCVVALLGFGRKHVGAVGSGAGFDFYPLRGGAYAPSLKKAAGRAELACTEHHNLIFSAPDEIVRSGTLADYLENPKFLATSKPESALYRWKPEGPAAWAMSVDLNACIGCGACVVACQAENNIPVVGKQQVIHEREMHWLRIDRYYAGTPEAPASYFQPMLCMHCEQAPCELVCPVGATVHDSEGLNVMIYNRCIGTRFCSNNCPYKVRRFNYFAFAREEQRPPEARNPEVTVRARGVMEKCTFCLQRIAQARITADREDKPVGDVVTACQAACPTRAFTFGDMANPDREVAKRKQSPLDYALLADQNTHPRVTYEALIKNPNPSIRGNAG